MSFFSSAATESEEGDPDDGQSSFNDGGYASDGYEYDDDYYSVDGEVQTSLNGEDWKRIAGEDECPVNQNQSAQDEELDRGLTNQDQGLYTNSINVSGEEIANDESQGLENDKGSSNRADIPCPLTVQSDCTTAGEGRADQMIDISQFSVHPSQESHSDTPGLGDESPPGPQVVSGLGVRLNLGPKFSLGPGVESNNPSAPNSDSPVYWEPQQSNLSSEQDSLPLNISDNRPSSDRQHTAPMEIRGPDLRNADVGGNRLTQENRVNLSNLGLRKRYELGPGIGSNLAGNTIRKGVSLTSSVDPENDPSRTGRNSRNNSDNAFSNGPHNIPDKTHTNSSNSLAILDTANATIERASRSHSPSPLRASRSHSPSLSSSPKVSFLARERDLTENSTENTERGRALAESRRRLRLSGDHEHGDKDGGFDALITRTSKRLRKIQQDCGDHEGLVGITGALSTTRASGEINGSSDEGNRESREVKGGGRGESDESKRVDKGDRNSKERERDFNVPAFVAALECDSFALASALCRLMSNDALLLSPSLYKIHQDLSLLRERTQKL